MHRAPAALAALLMAAALLVARAQALPGPLPRLNPWLSACDLVRPSADLHAACYADGMAPSGCPPPCTTNSSNQCLYYLEESHKHELCNTKNSRRHSRLQDTRLPHCCEHAVTTALGPDDLDVLRAGGHSCRNLIDDLLQLDVLAARISCKFTEVLTRYDCGQPYSIVHHCNDCKEAYRRWVCSSLVPHWTSSKARVRPCRSVCQTVEQRCPYLLPGDTHPTQYAGEPTFLCLDPNIPETGKQKVKSSHGDDSCCYTYCGTPGRPSMCPNCPGHNETWPPVACNASNTSARGTLECWPNLTALPTLSASKACPILPQTLHIILIVYWTKWTMIQLFITCLKTISNILHCSLLMCVQCVRTPLALIKTKWKSRSL